MSLHDKDIIIRKKYFTAYQSFLDCSMFNSAVFANSTKATLFVTVGQLTDVRYRSLFGPFTIYKIVGTDFVKSMVST